MSLECATPVKRHKKKRLSAGFLFELYLSVGSRHLSRFGAPLREAALRLQAGKENLPAQPTALLGMVRDSSSTDRSQHFITLNLPAVVSDSALAIR
ncbi:MAG: hypothetical protein KME26_19390 [Oscillatoria princeps RMCB-10]|nr:hypothetical protein [Oscillatoria princeps RMCB-10]